MIRMAYAISSALTILVALFFGCLIFFRGRGGRIVKSYFLLIIFIALWAAGMFNMIVSQSADKALLWSKILLASAAFIPAVYFRFIMMVLAAEKKYKFILRLGYVVSGGFAALALTPFIYKDVIFQFGAYRRTAGEFLWIYILYFLAYPILAHVIASANRSELTHLARKQLKYISIAAILGFAGGASTFLPMYGLLVPLAESIIIFFIPLSCAFIAIATYTARLIDIELFKRRAFVFSVLYGLTVGLFVCFVFVIQNILQLKFDINRFVFPISALFIITIFIRPLEHALIRWTDRFLYQREYNYQKTLEDASTGMLFITDIDKLLKLIVRILSKYMRVTNSAVYLYNKEKGLYECRALRRQKTEIQKEISSTSALVEWLKEKQSPLTVDDITNWLQKQSMFPHKIVIKRTLEQLRVIMRSLGAAVCVPAFIRAELIGFLVLGDKLSGVNYTKNDIALLSTLSNSAAVAIENAHMYEELHSRIKRVAELYKEQHDLFIDTATAFSYAIDLRNTYSRQHAQRLINYCTIIIKGLDKMNAGYSKSPDFLENLKVAALLHDVGKVAIPDAVLNKKKALTIDERKTIKKHIDITVNILKPIEELGSIIDVIKHHHEFYNGEGYPEGLKGEAIPFASRILAVANAYDAMTSERPYRSAMTHQKAAERLKLGSGKDFDPLIVEALLVGFQGIGPARAGANRTKAGEIPPALY